MVRKEEIQKHVGQERVRFFTYTHRFTFFYDLLLYNNVTQNFRIYRGFTPSTEDNLFTATVSKDFEDEAVSSTGDDFDEAYSVSYLRQVHSLAKRVLDGLPHVLETGITYENSK